VRQAVQNLIALVTPGGWIQLDEMEMEKQIAGPGIMGELGRLIKEIFVKAGSQWGFTGKLKGMLIDAGLEEVGERDVMVQYGKKCENEGIGEMSVEGWVMSAE
jgi:hypothetical protein